MYCRSYIYKKTHHYWWGSIQSRDDQSPLLQAARRIGAAFIVANFRILRGLLTTSRISPYCSLPPVDSVRPRRFEWSRGDSHPRAVGQSTKINDINSIYELDLLFHQVQLLSLFPFQMNRSKPCLGRFLPLHKFH